MKCQLSSTSVFLFLSTLSQLMLFLQLLHLRPSWEGGEYNGDESVRLDTLKRAISLSADFIDVELQVLHFQHSTTFKADSTYSVSSHYRFALDFYV